METTGAGPPVSCWDCIGDAAHAMSPVGGFGVNLAIQDAVAAANLLTTPLQLYQRYGTAIPISAPAAVEARRRFPTAATQTLQRLTQRFGVDPVMYGGRPRNPIAHSRTLMAYLVGVGFRPERLKGSRSASGNTM